MPNFEGKLVRAAAVWTLCSLFLFCPLTFGTAVAVYSREQCMRPVNATRISRWVGNRMERWFKGKPGSSCGNLAVDPPMHVGSSTE
ncbi:hypothetical protein BCY84_12314 [Trypanosoma cruzi cruzi]|nr:hypothetical protein BCY84_12314 [Trypanosoma cruzi cruzi]